MQWLSSYNLRGNGSTVYGTDFLGTTDNVSLTLRANNVIGWRLAPSGTGIPNVIGGSSGNRVTSGVQGAAIGGGESGYPNSVTDDFGVVGGGALNQVGDNAGTTSDKRYAVVGGGWSNTANGWASAIGGGDTNVAGKYCAVAGGRQNNATGEYAAIGGGWQNTANNDYATVGGGNANTASGNRAIVGGGGQNNASYWYATVGGGGANTASGAYATIPGGISNSATMSYTLAAGRRAKANHDGAFVWADSTDANFASSANNQFLIRASGGITMYTNSGATVGAELAPGSGSWASVSDKNLKANLAPTVARAILARVATLPIQTWNYTSQDAAIRHIGPMAQEFYAAFQVGEDDRHISTVDADGVALAAIQGLYEIVQEQEGQIAALKAQNAALDARLTALEQSVGAAKSPTSDLLNNGWTIGILLIAAIWVSRRYRGGAQ